ncbi:hypothetical protein [Sulfobacillus harzensis]|uniref:Uncharacterized protein n=1 Tax=Sulfobacillus harzensis TaxID=2729629 RepID=A0A7Y0L7T1_9FIRM|nr:hypothetical protein [Sulfobacillus harzensis]NMP24899.1 hypothetical protein [Sulfobacillus harzensis]
MKLRGITRWVILAAAVAIGLLHGTHVGVHLASGVTDPGYPDVSAGF